MPKSDVKHFNNNEHIAVQKSDWSRYWRIQILTASACHTSLLMAESRFTHPQSHKLCDFTQSILEWRYNMRPACRHRDTVFWDRPGSLPAKTQADVWFRTQPKLWISTFVNVRADQEFISLSSPEQDFLIHPMCKICLVRKCSEDFLQVLASISAFILNKVNSWRHLLQNIEEEAMVKLKWKLKPKLPNMRPQWQMYDVTKPKQHRCVAV